MLNVECKILNGCRQGANRAFDAIRVLYAERSARLLAGGEVYFIISLYRADFSTIITIS